MRVVKVAKLMLNARVGESGDRSVHAEKTSQRAEGGGSVAQKSLGVRKERGKPPDDDEVISTLQKAIEVFRKSTVEEVTSFTNMACRNVQVTIDKIEKTYQVVHVQLSRK